MRPLLASGLLGVGLVNPTGCATVDPPADPSPAPASVHRLDVRVDAVEPIERHRGGVAATTAEPKSALVVRVLSSDPPGPFAPGSEQVFGVNSLEAMGLGGWQAGDTISFMIRRSEAGEAWDLVAVPPS